MRGILALAAAGLLAGASSLGADDGAVQERVERRLQKSGASRDADVRVRVENGTVVLSGAATTVAARAAVERTARKEAKAVVNELKVVPAEPVSDGQLQKAVSDAILGYPRFTIFDAVGFEIANGSVLLSGSVQQPYRRDAVESLVASVPGVREIRNQIAVQPVSIFDDRLRVQLARAIYGDEHFHQYAGWPQPPVRILVDRGRVTLMGSVPSRVDQILLGHIARGVPCFGVDNQIQVEGDKPLEPGKAL